MPVDVDISRAWRLCLAGIGWLVIVVALLLALPVCVGAQSLPDPDDDADRSSSGYIVQPGDTLAEIAARVGETPEGIARANALRNPRQIYPGQYLDLGGVIGRVGNAHIVSAGDDLATLSRGSGASLTSVALANRLLLATHLPVGIGLWLPEGIPFRVVQRSEVAALQPAPRVSAAVVSGTRFWDVLWLNSVPPYVTQPLLVPEVGAVDDGPRFSTSQGGPPPLLDLTIVPQPVARGETMIVSFATAEPIDCRYRAFDREEDCLDAPTGEQYTALVGLSPIVSAGVHTMTLVMTSDDGTVVEVPLSFLVGEGRYDYERIDLPPDRQSLLDPALSQQERDKISQMRTVRSPDRQWEYPFERPVEAAVTSYFGSRRSYGYGFTGFHAGCDFDGEGGEPVLAPASGTVILAEKLVVRGNAVLVDHGWGIVSGFWHLSEIDVQVGDVIFQGERVGLLGNTGLSTGAHLHWELWVNGVAVNPLSWLRPDGPVALMRDGP